jgi:PAS domain S-box-containing protein
VAVDYQLEEPVVGRRSPVQGAFVTTLWDEEFFKRAHATALPEALDGFLRQLNQWLPSRHLALYVLLRGHLSLLISCDGHSECHYNEKVQYLQLQEEFRKDIVSDCRFAFRCFFRVPPKGEITLVPLRLENVVKGVIVFIQEEGVGHPRPAIDSFRPSLTSIATLISSVELLDKEQRRLSLLSVTSKISQRIEMLVEEGVLYKHIVTLIQKHFGYDHVAIYTLEKDAGALVLRAKAGKFNKIIPRDQIIPLGQGIISWVVKHDKTLLSNNVRKNPFFLNWTPDLIATEAELCVPVHVNKEIIGVLNIEHRESMYFDKDDTDSMELLADRIGIAIYNSRLYSNLERSYAHLQEIVSSMGQGLIVANLKSNIEWVNETMEKWGYGDLVGSPFVSLFKTDPKRLKDDLIQRTLADGAIHREVIKGRNDRYLVVITAPVLDGVGQPARVLAVIDDITASVQSQSELQRAKQELEAAQRLNSLGELAASIAHEIRNPLNAMIQAVDVLEVEPEMPVSKKRLLNVLKEESKSLNEILTSYLSRARFRESYFELWDLETIVKQVVSLLTIDESLAERIRFFVDIPEHLPPLRLDATSIKQLFLNLFINAIDSINGQGEIRVTASQTGQILRIQISDDGCGIDAMILPKIFEPFFTTKDRGTGLGLAVVRRIVERHGWEIGVQSKESVGTQFTLVVPINTVVV